MTTTATQTTTSPTCSCGCGASTQGWSAAGQSMGHRNGVKRIIRDTHGHCHLDGLALSQYGECPECGM